MSIYTNPDAAGCLLEAGACAVVIKELERLADKFKRKIDREAEKRKKELEAALEYSSIDEIHDAYGYEMITEQQYQLYTALFEQGEAAMGNHAPTQSERVRQILLSISKDLMKEQQEWEFSALSPEEQAKELVRRDAAAQEWKNKIKVMKEQVSHTREHIAASESTI